MPTDPLTGAFDTPEGLRVGALAMLNRALANVKKLPLKYYDAKDVIASMTAIEIAITTVKGVGTREPRA